MTSMYFIKFFLVSVLFVSCKDSICPKDLNSFSLRNSNYEYNCGLSSIDIISKNEIDYICTELSRLEKINFVMTSYNNGYITITYNTESIFFSEATSLVFTVKNGYIFKNNGNFYKNDVLANYLITLFKIENVYANDKCN